MSQNVVAVLKEGIVNLKTLKGYTLLIQISKEIKVLKISAFYGTQTLNLLPICYWHELLDLVFFFKITHGLVNVEPSVLPDVRKYRRTRSTTTNIKKIRT